MPRKKVLKVIRISRNSFVTSLYYPSITHVNLTSPSLKQVLYRLERIALENLDRVEPKMCPCVYTIVQIDYRSFH